MTTLTWVTDVNFVASLVWHNASTALGNVYVNRAMLGWSVINFAMTRVLSVQRVCVTAALMVGVATLAPCLVALATVKTAVGTGSVTGQVGGATA